MKKVLYPGSFDPPTYGHMNVVSQATEIFYEVIIAVMKNQSKKEQLFSIDERVALLKEIYKNYQKVKVISGEGAAVDVALLKDCKTILRGLRTTTDFEYELQLATINRKLSDKQLSTVCLFPDNEVQHISSSVVKELSSLDKDISEYVPPVVKQKMMERK